MFTIRPYQKKDYKFVQDICVATSVIADDDTPINRSLLCATYCDYYLDNQQDFCFVAEENGKVVGYVLCGADAGDYLEKMQQLYCPLIRKLDSGEYFETAAQLKMQKRYISAGYTAHFHMDVLPEYQHKGVGTQLYTALANKLKEICVEGLFAICGKKNEIARSFCQKCGMDDIDYVASAVVFGTKFFEE